MDHAKDHYLFGLGLQGIYIYIYILNLLYISNIIYMITYVYQQNLCDFFGPGRFEKKKQNILIIQEFVHNMSCFRGMISIKRSQKSRYYYASDP